VTQPHSTEKWGPRLARRCRGVARQPGDMGQGQN
jgi:hypothetical protein